MTTVMAPGPLDVGHDGRCNCLVRQQPPEGGKRCRRESGWGTDHVGVGACKLHGGSTPSHEIAAARVAAERRVGELLTEFGRDPGAIDPHEEVLEVVALTAGMVWVYSALVRDLSAGPAVAAEGDGGAEASGGLWGPDHKGDARPHEAVRALGEWTDRHLRACKTAADMGIDQRRIELAESTAQQLADVLRAGMLALLDEVRAAGLDLAAMDRLEAAVPTLLRGAIEGARVVEVQEATDETKGA